MTDLDFSTAAYTESRDDARRRRQEQLSAIAGAQTYPLAWLDAGDFELSFAHEVAKSSLAKRSSVVDAMDGLSSLLAHEVEPATASATVAIDNLPFSTLLLKAGVGAPGFADFTQLPNEITLIDFDEINHPAHASDRPAHELPLVGLNIQQQFDVLAAEWRRDTAHLSLTRHIIAHPGYQRIIQLGPEVVPIIVRELASNGGDWFYALQQITGDDPVRPEDRGTIGKMRETWLRWAIDHNVLS